ncbi:MAG: dipeptide ABC transporter periplasmic protein [Bacteroidetes bacterium]|nr:MAG: dipeptide ABC transporter periplasmic protein [Bacteroidota bacterium]
MNYITYKPRTIISLLVAGFMLTTCGDKQQEGKHKLFRYNELGDVNSLDPAQAADFESGWVVNQLYNGLVELDNDLHVQPCLAKSWTVSEDGKEYTFLLHDSVFFHDDACFEGGKGRKVVASDFEFSFDRLFNKKISKASTLVDMIDRDPAKGKTGFEAKDDHTFIIHLKAPFAPFISILAMKYFSVLPKEAVTHYAESFSRHAVGTGPFMYKNWVEGVKLVLVKNPNYFRTDEKGVRLPYLDGVVVNFIRDPESAFLQFMSGDLDMLSGMDAINKEKVLEKNGELKSAMQDKYMLLSRPFLKTDYLGVLVDEKLDIVLNSPLRKKLMRQALNYGLDRQKMIRYLRYSLGTPAEAGFMPPVLLGKYGKSVEGYEYNPQLAKQLLREAKYENNANTPPVVLFTTKQYNDIAEFVRNQWSEIGVKVEINVMEPSPFKSAVSNAKVNLFRKSWVGDYPDAENFMSVFYSKNFCPEGSNYMHFSNPLFDKLYERSMIEQNDTVRADLFRQMDQIVINEAPVIPLYYDQAVRLVQKGVENMTMDPTNMLNLERVSKK